REDVDMDAGLGVVPRRLLVIAVVESRDANGHVASPERDFLSSLDALAHLFADAHEHVARRIAEGHGVRREIVERAEIRVPAVACADRVASVAAFEYGAAVICERETNGRATRQRRAELDGDVCAARRVAK